MNTQQFFRYLKGKTVAFCGVGRTHMPLIELFQEKGAVVTVRDQRPLEKLGENGEILRSLGVELRLGEDYLQDLNEDIIFRTPGMRYHLPQLEEARARGCAVTSELELFFRLCPCKIYGVTGSDGKTTTTSIIAEFLKAQGKTVHLGGNIGKPLLPEIESIQEDHCAVVELSSFQLISMRESPDVAVVTNLSPNHLDVHKDMQEYIDAKKNILLHQGALSRTVLNAGNEITAAFAPEVRGDCWMFRRGAPVERGVWCDGKSVYVHGEKLLEVSQIKIPGWHNVENYMAAIAAVWGDVEPQTIRHVAETFAGVEHRAEFVRELGGVKYYNDSIATSPTRVISGMLSLFPQKILMIAGGYDKHIPFEPLGPAVCEKVKTLILLGSTAQKIQDAVMAAPQYREGCPEILRVETMEEAVAAAAAHAQPGDIVSLSPACAAFDLYPNFEVRGRHFKEIVNKL
ncbi:MAG TPA: UDP-N-acetylmuramoyl-L-alanine--D-glutamate ligase [Candidatus Acutalibacter stercorigallinarum]|nr:UDP-N-acetylmuramoyl-L-alanine--D-glutamate ligase [Candidatus Acutalibacter stercorigallinarum]